MRLTPLNGLGEPWWLTNVYGSTNHAEKGDFLQELRDARSVIQGPWLLCSDFNMFYQASDKNNGRSHRNRRTFERRSMTPPELLNCILDEANAWIGAGYGCLALLTAIAA